MMTQSILGQSARSYKKRLNLYIGFCIAGLALTMGLNILFTSLRTDSNHTWMLILNICADVLCGFLLLYAWQMHILPGLRLYRLFCRNREQVSGTVTSISQSTQRYMDLDCYTVTLDDRRVFLPVGTMCIEPAEYTLFLVSNIIVEAEQ